MIHYDTLWYIMIPYTPTLNIDELCRTGSGSALSHWQSWRSRGPRTTSRAGALSRYGWMGREPMVTTISHWIATDWSLGGTSCRFLQILRPSSEICSFWRHFSISCAHQEHCSISNHALNFKASRLVKRETLEFLGRYSTHFSVEHVLLFWRHWAYIPFTTGRHWSNVAPFRCIWMGAFKVDIFLMIGSLPRWGQTRLRGYNRDVNHNISRSSRYAI